MERMTVCDVCKEKEKDEEKVKMGNDDSPTRRQTPLVAVTLHMLKLTCTAVQPPCVCAGRDLWHGSCNANSNTYTAWKYEVPLDHSDDLA